jgi:serine/threonine-protein kinase
MAAAAGSEDAIELQLTRADLGNDPPSGPRLDAPASGGAAPARRKLSRLGDYLLLKKLGAGAMAAVYQARHVITNRVVALKVLFKHVAANPHLVERFHREARVAEKLAHPNIVHGFEVGEDHGWHFIAMEFVDGQSLQQWLGRLGHIGLGDALYIVLRCARALQYAHAMEMVHRDVKPDNILITERGEIKIADLGMVKQLDENMSLTLTGYAVGTPWYMPLEQAKNAKEIDGRCDIYALGCVFYACLTGHPPFPGKTLVDVIQAKELGVFPPARHFNHEVPERVDMILAKMAAKSPRYRYQNCAEFIRDLEGLGLSNAALSFLQPAGEVVNGKAGAAATLKRAPSPEQPGTPGGDVWYLHYRRPDGQMVVQRLTTAQALRLAETPDFDPGAKASRHAKEGFRALATIKEFEKVALGRAARDGADKQTFRSRKLYEKIVEEQSHRQKPEPAPATSFYYWLGILRRLATVGAFVGLMYWGASLLIQHLKGVFW